MSQDLQEAIDKHNTRVMNMRAARERLALNHTPEYFCDFCNQPAPCDVRLMLNIIDDYESSITWETNCTNCAGLWDQVYAQQMQVDALGKVARLTDKLMGQLDTDYWSKHGRPSPLVKALDEAAEIVPHLRRDPTVIDQ